VYPNLEINARFNLSAFAVNLQRRFVRADQRLGPGQRCGVA
jgi:hypothetical protein